MRSMRAEILNNYNRKLAKATTEKGRERIKGQIYRFLQRCQKIDRKKQA